MQVSKLESAIFDQHLAIDLCQKRCKVETYSYNEKVTGKVSNGAIFNDMSDSSYSTIFAVYVAFYISVNGGDVDYKFRT